MAEEVEIIRVAIQGTEMYLRLSGAAVKEALKFLKFLVCAAPNVYRWSQEAAEKHYRKETVKAEWKEIKRQKKQLAAGNVSMDEMLKKYKNSEITMLSIPDSSAERFAELSKKHKLNYTILPDLNVGDGAFQVMVPAEQAGAYNIILETLIEEGRQERELNIEFLKEEINQLETDKKSALKELKQMERNGKDQEEPERYQELKGKVDSCIRRKTELEKELMALDENYARKITFEDYIATNPQAFDHVDLFVELQDKGVELQGAEKISAFIKMPEGQKAKREKKYKEIGFAESLETLTKRKSIKEPVIVCDKNSPDCYMEVTAEKRQHEDRTFINTEFKVFNHNEEQRCEEFSHGKFTHYSDVNAKNSSAAGDKHWENMKLEIKEKSGMGEALLLFESKAEYERFIRGEEKSIRPGAYLVNPAMPDMAIRRDEISDSEQSVYRYTVMQSGIDTKVSFEMNYQTLDDDKTVFLSNIRKMIKTEDPDELMKSEWMVFDNTKDFETFNEVVKKNVPQDKEELKESFKETLGEESSLTKQMEVKSKQEAVEQGKILEIPTEYAKIEMAKAPDREVLISLYGPEMEKSYVLMVDKNRLKKDATNTIILQLKPGEDLILKEKRSRKQHKITEQKELIALLNGNTDFLKKAEPLQSKEKQPALHLQK